MDFLRIHVHFTLFQIRNEHSFSCKENNSKLAQEKINLVLKKLNKRQVFKMAA